MGQASRRFGSLPIGTVIDAFASAQLLPSDNSFIRCNGATLLQSAYPALFTAVGHTFGKVWTLRAALSANIQPIFLGFVNSLFIVAGANGGANGNNLATSPDGITWTQRNLPSYATTTAIMGVAFGAGLYATAGGWDGNSNAGATYTSPDGATWTRRATPSGVSFNAIAFGNGVFVAVNGGNSVSGAMTSPDGITWTQRSTTGVTSTVSMSAIAHNGQTGAGSVFVAAGASGGQIVAMRSADGQSWTAVTMPALPEINSVNLAGLAYGNGQFVLTLNGQSTTGYGRVMVSSDGINWSFAAAPVPLIFGGNLVRSATAWHTLASAGSSIGLASSSDLINWVISSTFGSLTNSPSLLAFGASTFSAMSQNSNRAPYTAPLYSYNSATEFLVPEIMAEHSATHNPAGTPRLGLNRYIKAA